MGALANNSAVIQNDDLIRTHHRCHPLGYQQHGAFSGFLLQGFAQSSICFKIQG